MRRVFTVNVELWRPLPAWSGHWHEDVAQVPKEMSPLLTSEHPHREEGRVSGKSRATLQEEENTGKPVRINHPVARKFESPMPSTYQSDCPKRRHRCHPRRPTLGRRLLEETRAMIPEGGARFIRKICIECWRHQGKDLLVGDDKPNQAQPYGTQTVMPGARLR